jgi:hypothetical protein
MVRGRRRKQRQADIFALDTSIVERRRTCPCRESGQAVSFFGPVAHPDTGSPLDPAGFEAKLRFDLGIFDTTGRHCMPQAG